MLGLLAGVLSGMLGIGGGAIMVPALVLIFGYDMHLAIGTSLAVIVPIAVIGASIHYLHESVSLSAVLVMSSGAIIGALVGAKFAHVVPAEILTRVFGVVLLVISVRMIVGT
jgi:hypothetical protein